MWEFLFSRVIKKYNVCGLDKSVIKIDNLKRV